MERSGGVKGDENLSVTGCYCGVDSGLNGQKPPLRLQLLILSVSDHSSRKFQHI